MQEQLDLIHEKLDRIDAKIDSIESKLLEQATTLIRNTLIVDEHQRRSTTLEDRFLKLETELKPVKAHVELMNTISKIFIAIGAFLLFMKQMGFLDKIVEKF